MASKGLRAAVVLCCLAAVAGCGGSDRTAVSASAARDGLSLRFELSASGGSLFVDARVRNTRARPVYLDADQCGRVTEAVLARTRFEPEGRTWTGSLQAAKEQVLKDQQSRQEPTRLAPRIPGSDSSDPPPCVRPKRPVRLAADAQIAERWELPSTEYSALDEVGSSATVVRLEAVESEAPDELRFLDILPAYAAEEARAGRNVRAEQRVAAVLERRASHPLTGLSRGQLYDRLVAKARLRRWIAAQPANGWRIVQLVPPYPGNDEARLRLVGVRYERAAFATARGDGTGVALELPTERDRARVFAHRPATLPAGIRVIDEPEGYQATKDVLPGSLELPSGRVVVTELLDDKPLDLRVRPGRYPVYATLAQYEGKGPESVALGTLVLSPARTVRWRRAGAVAVDGGTTFLLSAEAAERLGGMLERDDQDPLELFDPITDSLAAHDWLVTEFGLGRGLNLIQLSSGNGDGVYPVLVGYDAAGRPTRVVVDFYLLHLDWPGSRD